MVPLNVRKGSLKGLLVLLSLLLAMAANMFPYGQSYAQSASLNKRRPQTISIAERPISTRVCMKQLSQSLMKRCDWFPTSQTRITFDGGRCTS